MQISTLLPHAVELCIVTCFHFTLWREMKPWERQTLCGLRLCLLYAAGCAGYTPLRTFIYITDESEREELREQRTTENKRILCVPGCVRCAQKKTVKYATVSLCCGTYSDRWNRWHADIIVFQCFKMSEDELMPSYFCLDETVAAVSTQHGASYQRNSHLPLIVEFWMFFLLFLSSFISMLISAFESIVSMTLLTPSGLTTVKNTSTASLWKRWTFVHVDNQTEDVPQSVFIQDLLTHSSSACTAITRQKIQITALRRLRSSFTY